LRADRGNGLLELLADIIETICCRAVDGSTDRGDQCAVIGEQGRGHGTELVLETALEAVTPKQTRSGPCVFVSTLNTFTSADGVVLNRNRRTVRAAHGRLMASKGFHEEAVLKAEGT
jgi:hypothetical protein